MYCAAIFLVFIAGYSFIVDPVSGIKCHECDSTMDNNHMCQKNECNAGSGYCYKFVSNDGDTFEKGCAAGIPPVKGCTTRMKMGTTMLKKIVKDISKLEDDSIACSCTNESWCNAAPGTAPMQNWAAMAGLMLVAVWLAGKRY